MSLDERMVERWPGYSEQSWAERFTELDRRYGDLQCKFYAAAMALLKRPTESGYPRAYGDWHPGDEM